MYSLLSEINLYARYTRAEKSLMAKTLYNTMTESGLPGLQLRVENVVLIMTFGNKIRQVTKHTIPVSHVLPDGSKA